MPAILALVRTHVLRAILVCEMLSRRQSAEASISGWQDVELPTVEALQNAEYSPDLPETPELTGGIGRMVTQSRTGNCWHGLFFDIENIGSACPPGHAIFLEPACMPWVCVGVFFWIFTRFMRSIRFFPWLDCLNSA